MNRSDYIFTASGFRKVASPLGSYSQQSQFPSKIKGTERTLSGIRSAASMLNKYNVNKHCITREDESVIKSHSMEKVFYTINLYFVTSFKRCLNYLDVSWMYLVRYECLKDVSKTSFVLYECYNLFVEIFMYLFIIIILKYVDGRKTSSKKR